MTKADLIEKVQGSRPDLSKRQVAELVDVVFDHLARAIRKDKRFSMPGFGTFVVKRRAGRVGRNPQTGAEIQIAPTKTVGFKPAPELKKAL
jgi:DNA-binding protein HU-beta